MGPYPDKLRYVFLPLTKPSECPFTPSKLFLCTGSTLGGKAICGGDSGGPLVVPRKIFSDETAILIGVASFGTSNPLNEDCDGRSVFAPVIPELKWIKANMGKP